MALYGSGRDASLIRSISKELVTRYVDTEVEIYKLSLNDTNSNLYGESDTKTYYNPVRVPCLIQRDEKQTTSDDYGIDYNRTALFAFLRDTLYDLSLVIEPGDIVSWNAEYYEVDQSEDNQYWAGKNPDTHLGTTLRETAEFGYNVSIVISAHKTRLSKLNLIEYRTGNNPNRNIPKFL